MSTAAVDADDIRVVLVIDDEDAIRQMLDLALTVNGLSFFGAPDGPSGIEAARRLRPDVILLDIMMPEVDGFHVLARLRENPELASTPVIFVTALATTEQQWEGWAAGADSYVTKPVDPHLLLSEIDRLTSGHPTS